MLTFATTIAIDGPAASGKSTLGARLADRLGYTFVDAGVLYRAITHQAITQALDVHNETVMVNLARDLHVEIDPERRGVLCIGANDISADLHSPAVNHAVAIVAAYPDVRVSVRRIQREIARSRQIVFAGRDIGTVVLPDADLKLFLQVSLKERVERRYASSSKTTPGITREQIRDDLRRRDELDTHRAESPMRAADDAVIVRTDGLSIDAALDLLMQHAARVTA
jgi:CMP/dCMP kinase